MDEPNITPRPGCTMVDGLYIKANGELPCWCHSGEVEILGQVDQEWLESDDADLVGLPVLTELRQTFLEGRTPYPDLCATCPALGTGMVETLRPTVLERLLVEPSYLCQLSCPECILPKVRLQLKKPPYYLEPELFRAFLERLQKDGVTDVRLVHFEGRGDPMLNQRVGELVRLMKDAYPESSTLLTTHGCYPYKPWIFESGLDVLRLSIDGATPESYGRYRLGGDFHKAIDLLKAVRHHRRHYRSRLEVIWKYILFEWNDTDEEMALAARLADELEVKLLFVLTPSRGKSLRFPDHTALNEALARVAPRTQIADCRDYDLGGVLLETDEQAQAEVAERLAAADGHVLAGDLDDAARETGAAVRVDLGPAFGHEPSAADLLPDALVGAAEARCRWPSTLSGLGSLALRLERWDAAARLFHKYLRIGPGADDREHVETVLIRLVQRAVLGTDNPSYFFSMRDEDLRQAESEVLRIDPGPRLDDTCFTADDDPAEWMDQAVHGLTLRSAGYLRWARDDLENAATLFEAYLEKCAPDEREPIEYALDQIANPLPPPAARSPLGRLVDRLRRATA